MKAAIFIDIVTRCCAIFAGEKRKEEEFMEKRNRKAGHSYSLRDRILAQIMVIIVTLTMIPFDSLVAHAATTTNVKSIGSIQTEYDVD